MSILGFIVLGISFLLPLLVIFMKKIDAMVVVIISLICCCISIIMEMSIISQFISSQD